jgi:hypothetical protein
MDSSLDFKQAVMARQANTMFQRILVTWAGDVLELRRRNLLVPRWESAPAVTEDQADLPDEPMKHAA